MAYLLGGESIELNHHYESGVQKFAFDFVKVDSSNSFYKGSSDKNENSYSYGLDVLAPADGVVVEVVDGFRDNKPKDTNIWNVCGNHIIIKHSEEEFSLLGHLKKGSFIVRLGESVIEGQKIAECGNSGNTTDAHLHY